MRTVMLLAAVVATQALASRQALAQSASTPPQIVVTGTGEARVIPDRALVTLGVQSRAATAAAAAADNARRIKAVLDSLRSMGLSGGQLTTLNYSVSPEMTGMQTPKVTGYIVTNTVRAEVRRLDDVGAVIDAALAKGANEVSSLQLYASKADSIRRAALAAAVVDARAEAEVLARAAGGSLGQLLELSSAQEPIRPFPQTFMRVGLAKAAPTPIEAGEQTVTATVTARWAFAK